MIKHTYERIGETLYEETLENGLRVYVFPKPDFGKCYAFFATRYGGMDTRFQLNGQWLDTPMGIAHYLEHKMFDTPDGGNALQKLSASGASPNAFTSAAITGYHFECTEGFWDNLRTLLEFVSVPYFTEESVQKEQGIIGQEIRMMDDNPGRQSYRMLLEARGRAVERLMILHLKKDGTYSWVPISIDNAVPMALLTLDTALRKRRKRGKKT